ncbi:MAG: pantoate--beta-alanine ligase [Chthoniobacteraceae bacterium]
MKILRSTPATSRFCRTAARPLVLVPTMGALHAGHASLIDRARRAAGESGTVLVSIYVNPAQFGPTEDFSRYPRAFAADRAVCAEHGADAIFHPATMYSDEHSTWVDEGAVSANLCGAARPGHFRGVCTVVLKLFTITQPDAAVFGMKDYQQCAVIRRMVRDLNLPVRVLAAPTVRERDGLALSSRNAYLTPEERAQAAVIRQALLAAQASWRRGVREGEKLRRLVWQTISTVPLARIDYVEAVDPAALTPVEQAARGAVIAVAVFFGTTRLIDNIQLR